MRFKFLTHFAVIATLLLGAAAQAQPYPNRPVKLIVAFAPGTGSDILGRFVAARMSEALGQPVVIENRAGAGGVIGSESVAKSAPDGYTLLLGTNATLITSPLLAAQPPYQLEKSFTPIGGVARTSMVMVTGNRPDSPRDLKELIGRAPGASFSSAGAGTIGHLTSEMLLRKLGLKMVHVPYKGSAQSLNDIARGEVLFGSDTPVATLGLIRGGQLRAIGVTGESRLSALPDVPTFAESGLRDMKLYAWWGIYGPAGTPPAVVDTVGKALGKAMADPESRKVMARMELESFPYTAAQLAEWGRDDFRNWQQFLSTTGIKIE